MEVTKEELDNFIQHLWEEELGRRCEENSVLRSFKRSDADDLTPYPCPGLDELVEKATELSAKGYKMRQELVQGGDRYFIIFEHHETK